MLLNTKTCVLPNKTDYKYGCKSLMCEQEGLCLLCLMEKMWGCLSCLLVKEEVRYHLHLFPPLFSVFSTSL